MTTCEHNTSTAQADHGNVTLSECDWGCGAILISITGEDGITRTMTADEAYNLKSLLLAVMLENHPTDATCQCYEGGEITCNWHRALEMFPDDYRNLVSQVEGVAALKREAAPLLEKSEYDLPIFANT